ncbi:hypothetical protein JL721_7479 [Aureococcus anophagefferens]|nr:hypothetical protein JL721_7479 [Aureococcus anophagefferens]
MALRFAALLLLLGARAQQPFLAQQTQPFLVVATQRTGSKWVMQSLRQQTCDVAAFDEIYLSRGWCLDGPAKKAAGWKSDRTPCHRDLGLELNSLEALFDDAVAPDPRLFATDHARKWAAVYNRTRDTRQNFAYGFKWMVNQGMDELWGPLLATARARRLRVVFLYRRDLLRMLVSIAHNKRQFDAHPKDEAGLASIRSAKIPLPQGRALLSQLDELASHFEAMDFYRGQAAALGVETLKVVYEDVVDDAAYWFHKAWKFLTRGLDRSASTCDAKAPATGNDTMLIHKDAPRAYVSNWPSVRATLSRSPKYACLVADDVEPTPAPSPAPTPAPSPRPPPPRAGLKASFVLGQQARLGGWR